MSADPFRLRALVAAMTWADRALCVGLVALALLAPRLARPVGDGPLRAVVTVGRDEAAVLPLDRDAEVTVHGRLGDVIVAVRGGAVRVVSSPCAQQVCVATGAKRDPGDLIACVPGEVLVRVRGGDGAARRPGTPDAVTR